MAYKMTVGVPNLGITAHFVHRDAMRNPWPLKRFYSPGLIFNPPPTPVPVDSTGNASVSCPMYGNDAYGDCGEAMAAHVDQILTFRQGKGTQSQFDVNALVSQYLKVSGGDNGLDEDEVVNRIWKVGIAGNDKAIIVDALDIDVTNTALANFAIDQFYTIQLAWSVPDAFIRGFAQGTVSADAGVPNPNNGHYTPLADIGGPTSGAKPAKAGATNLSGFYRLWTWGAWCWVSPTFVASVQPQAFIAFSPRQFDSATGLDSKGRHVTTQAALWQNCGGNPIPSAVLNAFPPPVVPKPPPVPSPNPPPQPVPPPPVPQPQPTPTKLFSFGVPAVRAGQRILVKTPVAMPAGIYDVVPAAKGVAATPAVVIPE